MYWFRTAVVKSPVGFASSARSGVTGTDKTVTMINPVSINVLKYLFLSMIFFPFYVVSIVCTCSPVVDHRRASEIETMRPTSSIRVIPFSCRLFRQMTDVDSIFPYAIGQNPLCRSQPPCCFALIAAGLLQGG